ncbi:hypothetical protein [Sutcliffiella rhizosphaerae]|uniref:hypothetical protein n=1 Tax=Sutcliffiella rhizosphaerae TaxID=2880967 RepID=UPI001E631DEC|nr:hypothetical protein [Sutcliffiella rhizosphaerae]
MSVEQFSKCPRIPVEIPVTVLSADNQTELWKLQQQKLSLLHENTTQVKAENLAMLYHY